MPRKATISRRISPCVLAYIARNFAIPYVGALIGFMALFMLVDSINGDLRDFLEENTKIKRELDANAEKQPSSTAAKPEKADKVEDAQDNAEQRRLIPGSVILTYLLAKQPQNLTYVIPFASLLAASFMTMMLGKNSELTAMRAAGMSLFTCYLPVWMMAALSCAVVLGINESWGPICLKKADAIEMAYLKHGKIKNRSSFGFELEHRDWLIDSLSLDSESTGVIVRQYRPDGTMEYLLAAQSAEYNDAWLFKNGFVKHYAKDGTPLRQSPEFFEELKKDFTESPENIHSHSIERNRMTIAELRNVLCSGLVTSKRELNLLKTLLFHRCLFPLAALVAALFGVSMTISTNRMEAMNGFATAVASLLLFYLLTEVGVLCVKNGWFAPLGTIAPILGGIIPTLTFLALAVRTMWRRA